MKALHRYHVAFGLLAAAICFGAAAEPDEDLLGKAIGYPIGSASGNWYSNPYRVGSWSALDKVRGLQTRLAARPATPTALLLAANPAPISYRYKNTPYTLADYLNRQRITGLLVIKNGEVVAEHYRYARTPDARFLSFSIAKSITSLLIGQAVARGEIRSLDERADTYASELAGSAYGATTVRQLLRMSSGLTFTERYDGQDDIARLSRAGAGVLGAGKPIDVLRSVNSRHSAPGEKFVYASAETAVLGRVLAAATGKNLATLTSERLWHPIGAENDAFWRVTADGQEQAHGGLSASLRDWGRLGWLLARDGKTDTEQVIPLDYLLDATDPARQSEAFKPRQATAYFGYGYQFWLMPLKARTFAMQGIHGQAIYIQPSSGIVLVQTAVYEHASGKQGPQPYEEREAFWRGVLQSLGGDVSAP